MPKVISANRLADGIVVYAGRDGSWSERLSQAKIFASKAEAETGLLVAQNDAKRNLVVEPVVVEVAEDASGPRAVTLREIIRARGPTIDFLPRTHAFAPSADPPPANSAKQGPKAVLRIPRLADTREHEPRAHELISAADYPDAVAR
jgi:sulfite reductase (NADPH) hemoprotein beta-component